MSKLAATRHRNFARSSLLAAGLVVAMTAGCASMRTGKKNADEPNWIDRLRPNAVMVEKQLGYRGGVESERWQRGLGQQ